eukprot:GHVU01196894.1.p4 GENE.GHVU01196894.1~~GHVU01196894.1.p4  ORF type:complete len:101 (+),score=2.81 GHVU01196894.1:141-443(+)
MCAQLKGGLGGVWREAHRGAAPCPSDAPTHASHLRLCLFSSATTPRLCRGGGGGSVRLIPAGRRARKTCPSCRAVFQPHQVRDLVYETERGERAEGLVRA